MYAAHRAMQLVGSPRTMTMMYRVGWKNWSTLLSTLQKEMLHIVLCGALFAEVIWVQLCSLCVFTRFQLRRPDSGMPTPISCPAPKLQLNQEKRKEAEAEQPRKIMIPLV